VDDGLVVDRKDVAGTTTLVLEFPKTAGEEMAGLSATEIDDAGAQSSNSKALAGSHVLVVASRREVRVLIRDALRNMSMLVDFVASIEEAASFCREGLPHAIIIDSILKGSRFTHFRDEILGEVPDFVFVEILEQGSTFEMSGTNGAQMARIGRDVVASSLPAALMFELSRGL
jgi:CheY-like chemotaxis protein